MSIVTAMLKTAPSASRVAARLDNLIAAFSVASRAMTHELADNDTIATDDPNNADAILGQADAILAQHLVEMTGASLERANEAVRLFWQSRQVRATPPGTTEITGREMIEYAGRFLRALT